MTAAERAELRRLAEEATPGPWRSFDAFGGVSIWADDPGASGDDDLEIAHMADERPRPNGAYIAAANPAAILALLDALDALDVTKGDDRSCFTCRHLVIDPDEGATCGNESSATSRYESLSGAADADDRMPTDRTIRCPGWAAKETIK